MHSLRVIEIQQHDEAEWQATISYAESQWIGGHERVEPQRATRADYRRFFKAMHETAELAAIEAQAERDGWLAGMGWL